MSFVFGVLILGALLSMIFGKKVAAMFVTGTAAVIGIVVIALLVLTFPLWWGFFHEPSHVESPSYSSYTPAYGSAAASPVQASAPVQATGYAPAPAQSATPSGPLIGISLEAIPYWTAKVLNTDYSVPAGVGCFIGSVRPGSPADAAGLMIGDVLASVSSQGQAPEWITPQNELPDFLARHGAGVPVTLHVYRLTAHRDFYVAATPQ